VLKYRLNALRCRLHELGGNLRDRIVGPLLCSECFVDVGLRLEARKVGAVNNRRCPRCGSHKGQKLDRPALHDLAKNFFQYGSYVRSEYGGACILHLGDWQKSDRSVEFYPWLDNDARLIEDALHEGVRFYAPATWRLGEMELLDELRDARTRQAAAQTVLKNFPRRTLQKHEPFSG
jgi:hypothetical protein